MKVIVVLRVQNKILSEKSLKSEHKMTECNGIDPQKTVKFDQLK